MVTVPNSLNISGKGLMSGQECSVNIFPSQEKGIRFYVAGATSPIEANFRNVARTDNCVVLSNNEGAEVILVEHFMAACAFCGLDSLDVCLDSPELPILDGSAIEWFNLFNENGVSKIAPPEEINFRETIELSSGNANLLIQPANEFKITYCVDFDHPELKNCSVSFDLSNKKEILESRTFGYLRDLEKLQKAGLSLGVTPNNAVGLTEAGYTTELRSELEPAKHKILDLIGDLYLTGVNPLGFKAHIIAKKAGHKSHIEFAKLISSDLKSV